MNPGRFLVTGLFTALLAVPPASAQSRAGERGTSVPAAGARKASRPDTFGTLNDTYYRVSFSQFTGYNGVPYGDLGNGGVGVNRYANGTFHGLVSALQLPAGAMIDYLELDSCEFNAVASTYMSIEDCDFAGTACTLIPGTYITAAPNTGCGDSVTSLTPYGPIDNFAREYIVIVTTPSGDGSQSLSGVIVGYHLSVSPAPAVASFVDVPTSSPIFKFVEALKASGITAGCDATHYCPNANLTRGQMAVFLAAGLGLSWN